MQNNLSYTQSRYPKLRANYFATLLNTIANFAMQITPLLAAKIALSKPCKSHKYAELLQIKFTHI